MFALQVFPNLHSIESILNTPNAALSSNDASSADPTSSPSSDAAISTEDSQAQASKEQQAEDNIIKNEETGEEYAADHVLVALDNANDGKTHAKSADTIKESLEQNNFNIVETVTKPTKTCGSVVSIEVPKDSSVKTLVQQLQNTEGVSFAEPDYVYRLDTTTETADATTAATSENETAAASSTATQTNEVTEDETTYKTCYTPNDPAAQTYQTTTSKNQYYLYGTESWTRWSSTRTIKGANVLAAWDVVKSNKSQTIAVLDTGVNLNHEDLKDNLLTEYAYDTYHNKELVATDSFNGDYDGHGTHCCGIAGATADNSIGIAGSSYNANILPIKVFNDVSGDPLVLNSDIGQAYEYIYMT